MFLASQKAFTGTRERSVDPARAILYEPSCRDLLIPPSLRR